MTYKFGFIGAGNMGGALLTAAANGNPSEKFAVYDVFEEKAKDFAEKYENVSLSLLMPLYGGITFQSTALCSYVRRF